jgi:hypothetical protein
MELVARESGTRVNSPFVAPRYAQDAPGNFLMLTNGGTPEGIADHV